MEDHLCSDRGLLTPLRSVFLCRSAAQRGVCEGQHAEEGPGAEGRRLCSDRKVKQWRVFVSDFIVFAQWLISCFLFRQRGHPQVHGAEAFGLHARSLVPCRTEAAGPGQRVHGLAAHQPAHARLQDLPAQGASCRCTVTSCSRLHHLTATDKLRR